MKRSNRPRFNVLSNVVGSGPSIIWMDQDPPDVWWVVELRLESETAPQR
jgi:hypothetical protein